MYGVAAGVGVAVPVPVGVGVPVDVPAGEGLAAVAGLAVFAPQATRVAAMARDPMARTSFSFTKGQKAMAVPVRSEVTSVELHAIPRQVVLRCPGR